MRDDERKIYIAELMGKFYNRMQSVLESPASAMQNDGIQLLAQVNEIIQEMDKLENPSEVSLVRERMELAKHRLSQAMMTNTQEE
jgi:hypothetical protein